MSRPGSNIKLLSITVLSHKINRIQMIQLQLSEKSMNVVIIVLNMMS